MSVFTHVQVERLPDGWCPAFFGDLVSFRLGRTPPRSEKAYWEAPAFPWVSISDMTPYGTILETAESVSETAHRDVFRKQLVPAGHTLMSFKLTIGRVAKLGIPAYHNEAIISFRPEHPGVDENFLFYYLSQIEYAAYRDKAIKGDTLNRSKLNSLEIALPPLAEQRQIAAVLSAVQRAVERQDRLIALTAELKKALMHKLFTEGTRGERQKQTEIGPAPESWEVNGLGSYCALATGTTPPTVQADLYVGKNPFIRTDRIVNARIKTAEEFVSDEALARYRLKTFPAGTVLLAMYGQGKTRGQVAILAIPASITQNAAAITCSSRVVPDFLYYYLMSQYSRLRQSGFAGQISHLNLGFLRGFLIPCPSIKEQRRIADVLISAEAMENLHQSKRRVLEDLFRSLLHQLMTAQVRVYELDLTTLEQAAQLAGGA
jgi:type I restriction enzyme S subunit